MSKRRGEDFYSPRLEPELLLAPLHIRKPSTILVNFTGDLFGDWVDPNALVDVIEWDKPYAPEPLREIVFRVIKARPEHSFLFLTKNPTGLLKWGQFPDNAWVGVSACNQKMYNEAVAVLSSIKAEHKWLSFEPLLSDIKIQSPYDLEGIEWVVIGAQSPYNSQTAPKMVWVQRILVSAHNAGNIHVWLKNNLAPVINNTNEPGWQGWRLELPLGVKK